MSKKFGFEIDPFSKEQVEQMSGDELQKEIYKLKRMIKEATLRDQETRKYEVELCYLQHEHQMRFGHERSARKKQYGAR